MYSKQDVRRNHKLENPKMENHGRHPSELLPWIQNQDPKQLRAFLITAGILARILSDFLCFHSRFQELPFLWAMKKGSHSTKHFLQHS